MFKWTMLAFFATYFTAAILLLLGSGFWFIPEGVLMKEGENFFLPFLLFQLAFVFLVSSQISEKRIQVLIMVTVLFLATFLAIREMVDVFNNQIMLMSRPLVVLALGQGILAMAYLINYVNSKSTQTHLIN